MSKTKDIKIGNLKIGTLSLIMTALHRYFYHAVIIYLITGLIVAGFVATFGGVYAEKASLLLALLINYVVAISLTCFYSHFRNFGVALIFCIATLCLPLITGFSASIWGAAIVYTYWVWKKRGDIRASLGRFQWRDYGGLLLVGLVFSAVILAAPQYIDFFSGQRVLLGQVPLDSLYHSAIASMIKNSGIVSSGLNGLVPLHYHVLSHYLFASISSATALPVTQAYGTIYDIVFIPLLLVSIVAAAEGLQPSSNRKEFYIRLLVIVLSFAGFFGYNAGGIFTRYGLWQSFLISESYTVGLILLMGMMSALQLANRKGRWSAIAILVVLAAAAKVSVGMIGFALLLCHLSFFEKGYLSGRIFLGLGAAVAVGMVGWVSPAAGSQALGGDLLHFLRVYVALPGDVGSPDFWSVLIKFNFIHFFYTWIFVLLTLNAAYWGGKNAHAVTEPLMFNAIAMLAGWGALVFLSIPGGSEYYFSNVSMFVALPFILIRLATPLSGAALENVNPRSKIVPQIILILGCVGLLLSGPLYFQGIKQKTSWSVGAVQDIVFRDYITQLKEIQQSTATKNLAVYVAKEESGFWMSAGNCKGKGFLIPAVSERSALFGLPDKIACDIKDYGFEDYSQAAYRLSAMPRIPHAELLEEAKRLGFAGYVDVTRNHWEVYWANS